MQREMNVAEFGEYIRGIADRIGRDPFTQALEDCQEPIGQGLNEIIQRAEDSHGSAWPPHAPATVKKYGPHPLEILTGVMLESLSTQGAVHNVANVLERQLAWGTSVIYGPTQNFGDPSRNIPAREFMYWTEPMIVGCLGKISDYIWTEIIV